MVGAPRILQVAPFFNDELVRSEEEVVVFEEEQRVSRVEVGKEFGSCLPNLEKKFVEYSSRLLAKTASTLA